jgi:hypothetical protein
MSTGRYAGLGALLMLGALSTPSPAQSGLNITGGVLSVGSGATLSVQGPLSNAGTLDNQGTLTVRGDLSNTGTIGSGTGQWVLGGSAQQALNLAGARLPVLRLDNPAGASLGSPAAAGTLTLLNGAIWLNAHNLSVDGGLTGTDGAAGRFVISNGSGLLRLGVGTSDVTFALGPAAGAYRPVVLRRSAGTGTFGVAVSPDALVNGSSGSAYSSRAVDLRWTVLPPDATPFDLTVEWLAADELPSFQRSQSALARWNGSQYAPAEAFGNAGGPAPYRRSVAGLLDGGIFVVLDRNAPLPVELTEFGARRPGARPVVELKWTTAQEQRNAGFEVQRRDEGQSEFRRVGYVPGGGTRTAPRQYQFQDDNDFHGLSYYRLRQLDEDGTASLSAVRPVPGLSAGAAFSLAAFPRPASHWLTLEAAGKLPAGLSLTLFAADGRVVRREAYGPSARRRLDVQGLPNGWYWLRYAAPGGPTGQLAVGVQH